MTIIGVLLLVAAFGLHVVERRSLEKSRLFGFIPPPVIAIHLIWIGFYIMLAVGGIACIVYDVVKTS